MWPIRARGPAGSPWRGLPLPLLGRCLAAQLAPPPPVAHLARPSSPLRAPARRPSLVPRARRAWQLRRRRYLVVGPTCQPHPKNYLPAHLLYPGHTFSLSLLFSKTSSACTTFALLVVSLVLLFFPLPRPLLSRLDGPFPAWRSCPGSAAPPCATHPPGPLPSPWRGSGAVCGASSPTPSPPPRGPPLPGAAPSRSPRPWRPSSSARRGPSPSLCSPALPAPAHSPSAASPRRGAALDPAQRGAPAAFPARGAAIWPPTRVARRARPRIPLWWRVASASPWHARPARPRCGPGVPGAAVPGPGPSLRGHGAPAQRGAVGTSAAPLPVQRVRPPAWSHCLRDAPGAARPARGAQRGSSCPRGAAVAPSRPPLPVAVRRAWRGPAMAARPRRGTPTQRGPAAGSRRVVRGAQPQRGSFAARQCGLARSSARVVRTASWRGSPCSRHDA
jgi:hypothetical protein